MRAYLIRRSLLIELGAGFRIVGSRYSPDTRRLREFAARNRLPHRWIGLEKDQQAEALLRELGVAPEETPVVIWRGELVLHNPSNAELARAIGLPAPRPGEDVCDLVIVGAGPAGLAAAVYAASEGPADRTVIQAAKFGARSSVPAEATAPERRDGHHVVRLGDGESVAGRSVVATGAHYRKLAVPRLEEFEGTSVHYAATRVEAQTCRRHRVAVALPRRPDRAQHAGRGPAPHRGPRRGPERGAGGAGRRGRPDR